MRTPLLVGNWKMNLRLAEARALATVCAQLADTWRGTVEVGIAPPTAFLAAMAEGATGSALRLCAQNLSPEEAGAYTGETAASMLTDLSCWGSLVGHSERRHLFGETDEETGRKVARARAHGLRVILCVGETLEERSSESTLSVVERQLLSGVAALDSAEGLVVAYEPVWAIGTGRTASAADAQEVHAFLRSVFATRFGPDAASALRIQYGGSAKPSNAAELLAQPDVDGLLIGGASLDAESFSAMVRAAAGQA